MRKEYDSFFNDCHKARIFMKWNLQHMLSFNLENNSMVVWNKSTFLEDNIFIRFCNMKSSERVTTSEKCTNSNGNAQVNGAYSTKSSCEDVKIHLMQSKNPSLKRKLGKLLNGTDNENVSKKPEASNGSISLNGIDPGKCICERKSDFIGNDKSCNCEKYSKENIKFAFATVSSNEGNIEQSTRFNRKHVKLKPNCSDIDMTDNFIHKNDNPGKSSKEQPHENESLVNSEFYVAQSIRRLALCKFGLNSDVSEVLSETCTSLLENVDAELDVVFEEKESVSTCQPKKMRSSLKEHAVKSTSSEESADFNNVVGFKCEWHDCTKTFSVMDKFTKHVRKEHIQNASKNDVFVCLWRNCRFSNQPSCSYKWLSKHVLRHCDLKPFKCVIFGCDMAFVTQSGLARHVPTHFNEGNVRRACVKTNTIDNTQGWESPKVNKNLFLKLNSVNDFSESSRDSTSIGEEQLFSQADGSEKREHRSSDNFSQRNYSTLKKKIQMLTCNAITNHGYMGKFFRIEHQVIGKRTLANGESDVLLGPSVQMLRHRNTWYNSDQFNEMATTHVDLPISKLPKEAVTGLCTANFASRRRKRTRK